MISVFSYTDDLGELQYFEVDVDLSRSHRFEATLAESPIEDGTPVTDHVVIGPWELSLELLVTDTPIKSQAVYPAQSEVPRSQQAFARLLALFRAKTLVEVLTPYGVYSNGIITAITLPEDQQHAGSAAPSVTIKEIHIAQSQAVLVAARKSTRLKKTLPAVPVAAATKVIVTAAAAAKQVLGQWLLEQTEIQQKARERVEEVTQVTDPAEFQKLKDKYWLEDLREVTQ